MSFELQVSRDIAASPAAVYAAITDVTRMGEWSPETVKGEWAEGSDGPAVGARFVGHNRHGEMEWTTTATVVDLVENERFHFDCDMNGFVFAKWGYDIEPTDGGCRITESTSNLIPEEMRPATVEISGIEDRAVRNQETMTETLDRLAAAVE
ncbi:MAG: SRPBCC family protein [Acidimicrobiales bacterium]